MKGEGKRRQKWCRERNINQPQLVIGGDGRRVQLHKEPPRRGPDHQPLKPGRTERSEHARPRPLYLATALKDPCVRALARRPAPPRGAREGEREGEGERERAVLRPGFTCPRSPLPFPEAARAGGFSCQANGRPVSIVRWRTHGDTTIPQTWTRLLAGPGQRLA